MKETVRCPKCEGRNVIKKGRRRNRYQILQKYKCKDCGLNFVGGKPLGYTTYSAKAIMTAINNYNQGLTLGESSKEINKRFGVRTYPKLISSWLQRFKDTCPYLRIRKNTGSLKEEKVLYAKQFYHLQLYLFKYHKVKLNLFVNKYFSGIANYLQAIPRVCPNELFLEENLRCSQLRSDELRDINVTRKENFACKLSDFALKAIRSNKERHAFVEEFMLLNDTATIAVEIPVWLFPEEIPPELEFIKLEKPLTGHIDLLQARYGLIYILDYKPNASKVNAISQLFAYALALSLRTDIWLRNFRCAWFDERDYYEFNPNELVLPKLEKESQILRKYVLDEEARRFYTSKQFHEIYHKQKEGKMGKNYEELGDENLETVKCGEKR